MLKCRVILKLKKKNKKQRFEAQKGSASIFRALRKLGEGWLPPKFVKFKEINFVERTQLPNMQQSQKKNPLSGRCKQIVILA